MNINDKKLYLKANELYKEGKTAEAIKLWSSLSQTKAPVVNVEPLIWKLMNISIFTKISSSKFITNSFLIFCSFFCGRAAFLIFILLGELLYFKTYPDIYIFISDLSIDERTFFHMHSLVDANVPFENGGSFILSIQQYFVGKVIHLQSFLFNGQQQLNSVTSISSLLFSYSFGLMVIFVAIGTIVDLYLSWKVVKVITIWMINLLSQKEYWVRFMIAFTMGIISLSFFILVFKKFEKKPELNMRDIIGSLNNNSGTETGDSESNNQNQKSDGQKSELKFLEEFTKELKGKSYSINERKAITKMYNDYIKMLKKYNIKGGQKEQPTVQEIIDFMKEGKLTDLENRLKQLKALNDLKKLQGEYGENGAEEVKEADKEFADVLKKSFMSSDQKTMDEYLKTAKEFEELYGKEIKDRVFSGENQKELMERFSKDPQKAQEFAREESNKLMKSEKSFERSYLGNVELEVMTRINTIINYLECGGDIKIFNQMRMQFLKDYTDPNYRIHFAMRVDFVMASWNEHQNKYFWQMNRALSMEIVEMMTEAAKAVNFDIRRLHLGWFYLVAGYYEKAREECLKSVALEESESYTESEGSYVNRSNAALAALMLNLGKTAYIEYRFIYKKVLEKKGSFRNKREEFFTEYIREITAALASPMPCKEAYLCRSMFLEDVNDELALNDLIKYLALSPEDELLVKEATLKAQLIKARLEMRKNK